jgi:hypothetical protein
MSISKTVFVCAALGTALAPVTAAAQCRPPTSSHEARLLAFYEVPAVFALGSAPERLPAGAIKVGAEAEPVPSPNAALTHPQYCYQYTTNNTKLASLFGRPRLTIGLPGAMTFEASYLPPVTVMNARATVASAALSRFQSLSFIDPRLTFALRAHATVGRITGPITCSKSSLQTTDASAPCYGSTPSRDHFDPNSLGIEGAMGTTGRIAIYAGGGANWVRPHFQAGFTDAVGNVDHTTVDIAVVRGVAFAGASFQLRDALTLSGQVYAVPADVTTTRVGVTYRLR